ncbi:hypothetical protein U1Q18_049992 [Sarracenia purpurea var. burkii]
MERMNCNVMCKAAKLKSAAKTGETHRWQLWVENAACNKKKVMDEFHVEIMLDESFAEPKRVFKRFPVMVMGRAFKDFPFHVDFMLKNGTIKRVTMDVQLNETEVKMRTFYLKYPGNSYEV